ncbi:response regulator [uncultured Erythrobacter sp.]|uniref:response regulator n=1 Tax=uncultured Erythrobacter sp. TaxID=263913 RepID=UPI002631A2FA|nr:response regulator [uncultured Erythrobacter sp.]
MAKILVMEDCTIQALMLADLLEIEGHETAITHTASAAIAHIDSPDTVDLLVTDIFDADSSDTIDGFALINHIRSHRDPAVRQTPIVSISGISLEAARERSKSALTEHSSDTHFTKPVDMGELIGTVARLLN